MNKEQKHFESFLHVASTFFPAKEVLYVFEMGAKDCSDTLRFNAAFPLADIYTFECNQETLPLCRAAVAGKDKIHLTEKAVSDTDGTVTFYPIDTEKTQTKFADGNPGASSMFKASGKYPAETYVQKTTTVPSVRLETFMNEKRIPGIDVLWLDTQGAELKVLQGLGRKLRTVRFIHTEVEFMEMYSGQPLWKDIKGFLTSNGFTFVGFTHKGKYFGDAVFVNNDVASRIGMMRRLMKLRYEGYSARLKGIIQRYFIRYA